MARQIDPAILSILAKVDTTGMKHTQKLDAFAKALGHKSQTACMHAGKRAKKAAAQKNAAPKAVTRADIEMEVFRRVHGTDLDPLPREDFSYELINRDTNFSAYEEWWEHHIEHRGPEHWETILGADLAERVDAFTAFSDPQALAALRAAIAEGVDLRIAAGVSLDMDPEEADAAVAEHMHRKQADTAPVEEKVNAKIQDLATSLLRLGMPRPRDLPGDPVWAEMWSDDRIVEVTVDVRPFLAKMTASDYAALRLERFEPGNASDNAFYALEKTDADAASLSAYLAAVNDGYAEVGFSVRIDAEAAEAWVAEHRPEIWGEPVLVEVLTKNGDIFDMDIRPILGRADDATVSAVLGGDTDKLRSFEEVALSAAEAVILYEEGREAAKDWAAACRPHILTSATRPGI